MRASDGCELLQKAFTACIAVIDNCFCMTDPKQQMVEADITIALQGLVQVRTLRTLPSGVADPAAPGGTSNAPDL